MARSCRSGSRCAPKLGVPDAITQAQTAMTTALSVMSRFAVGKKVTKEEWDDARVALLEALDAIDEDRTKS